MRIFYSAVVAAMLALAGNAMAQNVGAVPVTKQISQSGIPIILPSSGSIGNNGALTGLTALPQTFANCYMYFPANAIASGSTAGVYFVQMGSSSAGTIYNNPLSSGKPTIPASPTPFVTTGPGAYTQTTSSPISLLTIPIAAGALGNSGNIYLEASANVNNNSDSKFLLGTFGGTTFFQYQLTSQIWGGLLRRIQNTGSQSTQVTMSAGNTQSGTDFSLNGSASNYMTVNTANAQNLVLQLQINTATDFAIPSSYFVQIRPSN
ncbi:MAG TPA: hypothetical protein VHW09_26755 [Bryobacteraceae bacterium]|jgi:hypothetical protein|nr:hypothetical protein [Bryobacteraceae bacterium]